MSDSIRVIAICVFRRADSILVSGAFDSVKNAMFYRPLGGGVLAGESSRDAVVREIKEEIGCEVVDLELLGVLENVFTLEGRPGHEIVFMYMRTAHRFDAIFCDALSWIRTRSDFEAALRGFRDALRPGGLLLFLGAPEGAPSGRGRQLLHERWREASPHALDWHHAEGQVTCTKMSMAELGADYLDRHHLFLIEEAGAQRLERATIRESVQWSWDRLVPLFSSAGFSDLSTYAVRSWSSRGMAAGLNVAVR